VPLKLPLPPEAPLPLPALRLPALRLPALTLPALALPLVPSSPPELATLPLVAFVYALPSSPAGISVASPLAQAIAEVAAASTARPHDALGRRFPMICLGVSYDFAALGDTRCEEVRNIHAHCRSESLLDISRLASNPSMIPSSSSRADRQHSLAGGNVLHAFGRIE
jgi:hypothetical protein